MMVIHKIPLQGCYGIRDGTMAQCHKAGSSMRSCADKSGQVYYGGAQSMGMANIGESRPPFLSI
jgi:hypothetical protein